MAYKIMCKRSKCDNIIFGDGVMQEIIDLIDAKDKNLSFVRENIVTSRPHGLLANLLAKACDERLDNNLSCGVHYKIYDSNYEELMHAMICYSKSEYSHTEFEVRYHNMPALEYTVYKYDEYDPELYSDILTFFGTLRKKSHKFKDRIVVFDFDDYFNTPREFRRRKAVYPLPTANGGCVWARIGERRAMRQIEQLQKTR